MKFAVLLGGPLSPTPRLLAQCQGCRSIAADGGMAHAQALGLQPELWVGDFDSVSTGLLAQYAQVPQQRFSTHKDYTDGELAVSEALQRGATEIWLVGALGGQSDHSLAHWMLAVRLAQQGLQVVLTSGSEEGYPLVPGQLSLEFPPATRFSLVALTPLSGLSLYGAKWPLQRVDIPLGSSRTLSNQSEHPTVELRLEGGYGAVVAKVG